MGDFVIYVFDGNILLLFRKSAETQGRFIVKNRQCPNRRSKRFFPRYKSAATW